MYDVELQKLYLGVILADGELAIRVRPITNALHFDIELRKAVNEMLSYMDTYDGVPDTDYISSKTGVEIKTPNKVDDAVRHWFIDEYPKFCLHKALEGAVVQSSDFIEKQDYEQVEEVIKVAMETRLIGDYGLDYGANPKERLLNILSRSGNISSGYAGLDHIVGSLNYGDLVIYAGGSGCVTYDTPVSVKRIPTNVSSIDSVDSEVVAIGSLMGQTSRSDYAYLVDSPDGWVPVLDCVKKIKDAMFLVEVDGVTEIEASHDHLFQKTDLSWWYARNLAVGDTLLTKCGEGVVTAITPYNERTEVYDLSVGHENHRYYTDDVCSHNTGKSLFLQNNAIFHRLEGRNVLYITLELHEELCARRMDAMLLEQPTKHLYNNIDATDMAIRKRLAKAPESQLKVKYMASGSKTSDIKAFIKNTMINTGVKPDVVLIDYLDLISPVQKVSVGDTFNKDKAVAEELRNIMQELEILCLTASQLNRGAVGSDDLDHSHIAGGMSKINTADLVLGIITTNAMREKGIYELQVLKTRNSSGTGRKVRLSFMSNCMKIKDDPEFLANINTYMQSSNTANTSVSESEKLMNAVQNQLNTDDESYTPVEIETGQKLPKDLVPGMGSNKIDSIRAFLNDDDEDDLP